MFLQYIRVLTKLQKNPRILGILILCQNTILKISIGAAAYQLGNTSSRTITEVKQR